jgi:hypothetical protein
MARKKDLRDQPLAVVTQDEAAPVEAAVPVETATSVASGAPFRLRFWPILIAIMAIAVLELLPSLIVGAVSDYVWLPVYGSDLASSFATNTVMALLALAAIFFIRRSTQADFGLHLPRGRSYVATALILGVLFGGVMVFIDYGPEIIRHAAPHDYESRPRSVAGWLLFQGLYVGPTEEIPFRSLLVTWLTLQMPGRVRFRGFEMNGAGVAVAAIFGICFGLYALIAKPFLIALGETFYVFLGSVALAYWFEKSRSILAPVVGHNAALFTWQALVFAMVSAWRT